MTFSVANDHNKQKSRLGFWLFLLALGTGLFLMNASAQTSDGADASTEDTQTTVNARTSGIVLSLNGPVTPASADYLKREIEAANTNDADLIVIEIDTPGGLVDSMKTIIKAVLASETPVATFVSPQGARSASAGLYIMYAAHISAMAPNTNTGAATPVEVGGGQPAPQENPFEGETPVPSDADSNDNAEEESASEDVSNGVEEILSLIHI